MDFLFFRWGSKWAKTECYKNFVWENTIFKKPRFNYDFKCYEKWFYFNHFKESSFIDDEELIESPKLMKPDQKIMHYTAFSLQGLVMIELLPHKCKLHSYYICKTILPKINLNTLSHPEIWPKKLFLNRDNAKPHLLKLVKWKKEAFNMEELPHPTYSPDFCPNNL